MRERTEEREGVGGSRSTDGRGREEGEGEGRRSDGGRLQP